MIFLGAFRGVTRFRGCVSTTPSPLLLKTRLSAYDRMRMIPLFNRTSFVRGRGGYRWMISEKLAHRILFIVSRRRFTNDTLSGSYSSTAIRPQCQAAVFRGSPPRSFACSIPECFRATGDWVPPAFNDPQKHNTRTNSIDVVTNAFVVHWCRSQNLERKAVA